MAVCKECEYYNLIDGLRGNCFGHEVLADMPVEKCPAKTFEPKEK